MAKSKELILVTGAGGCVGHLVVEELVKEGRAVVAADLPGSQFPSLESGNVRVLPGDLTDTNYIESITEGVTRIINTAAIVDIAMDFKALEGVNLQAVKNLYTAAKKAGVTKMVQFSSCSVYAAGDKPISEDGAVEPSNAYEETKVLADEFLRSQSADNGPVVNILRPTMIVGPRGRVLGAALATVSPMLKILGGFTLPLKGGPRSNWVHARDVARAAIFLVFSDSVHGEIFNVGNDEYTQLSEVFNTAFELGELTFLPGYLPLSKPVMSIVAPLLASYPEFFKMLNFSAGLLWNLITWRYGLTRDITPRLDAEAMVYANQHMMFDNSKIKKLGFSFNYPTFRDAWNDTLTWYRTHNWTM